MSMTIQSSVKDKILATSNETSKVDNTPAEMLRDLDQQMEKRADDGMSEMAMTMQYRVRGMILTTQSEEFKKENVPLVRSEVDEAHSSRSPVLWAEIGESSLTGPELVLDTTDKVVLIKEKLKAARDRQKSYADNRRKPLEFEVGDRVMLKVSPWKGEIRFGKKGKLAPRYVGPFEILERVNPVAYRLRLPEELSGIKVDKTLRFVEEPVENSDREVKRLKCSRMVVVKVHLGSKRVGDALRHKRTSIIKDSDDDSTTSHGVDSDTQDNDEDEIKNKDDLFDDNYGDDIDNELFLNGDADYLMHDGGWIREDDCVDCKNSINMDRGSNNNSDGDVDYWKTT
ncbi:hypothetical protein Tco_1213629 [Tanacetum coccineum]